MAPRWLASFVDNTLLRVPVGQRAGAACCEIARCALSGRGRHPPHATCAAGPAKTDPPPIEAGYRLLVEVEALAHPEEDNGWTVLATTISAEVCTDVEILQAYQEQHSTVESGFRWIKNPAAISPVWLEKPARIAALAMLTVAGLLVYSIIQRQVRLYLRTHAQQLPGNKGLTATPTAAVVLALFTQVTVVHLCIDEQEVLQLSGVQTHHLLVCDALGLDASWYIAPSGQKNARGS